jgi:hypothetical protein
MKSELIYGLAISASLALAGVARADNYPANPVLLPAPSAPLVTLLPQVIEPPLAEPSVSYTPVASAAPQNEVTASIPSPPTAHAKVAKAAHAHVARPKPAPRVAFAEPHPTYPGVASGYANPPDRIVPQIFMIGVAY